MGAGSSSPTSEWSSDEVAAHVSALGPTFAKFESVIKEYGVNGETLLALTPQDLSNYVDEKIHLVRLGLELQKLREAEFCKLGDPMVDWLKSINVRIAERYATTMKEAGYDEPSEVEGMPAEELVQMFHLPKGFANKIVRYFAERAAPSSSSSAAAPAQLPLPPAAVAKQSLVVAMSFRWEWCASDGMYLSYGEVLSLQVEEAHKKNLRTVTISCEGSEYVVDFGSMKQKRVHNTSEAGGSASGRGGITRVRRWNAKDNFPPSWDHQPEDQETHVADVRKGTADWKRVEETVYKRGGGWTANRHKLVSVQRIQNRSLLKRYQAEKQIITSKRGAGLVNEQYLFFGSGRTEPQTIATSSDGFMVEHGRDDAFYGKGCYFALQARYSHHYAHTLHSPGSDCHRQPPRV
jgi:hypothetical protein